MLVLPELFTLAISLISRVVDSFFVLSILPVQLWLVNETYLLLCLPLLPILRLAVEGQLSERKAGHRC